MYGFVVRIPHRPNTTPPFAQVDAGVSKTLELLTFQNCAHRDIPCEKRLPSRTFSYDAAITWLRHFETAAATSYRCDENYKDVKRDTTHEVIHKHSNQVGTSNSVTYYNVYAEHLHLPDCCPLCANFLSDGFCRVVAP